MDGSTRQPTQVDHLVPYAGLLRLGSWAALASVLMILVQVAVYVVWPPPEVHDAPAFLTLLVEDPLHGLIALDVLYILSNVLAYLLYFALAAVLWRTNTSAVVVALAFGVLGIAAYMASVRPLEMLTLAGSWADADPAERVAIAATGEGMLATWTGTAFTIYYLFNLVTLLVLAWVMLRSADFTRATAVWGLVAAGLMAVPSNAGTVGMAFAFASLIPWSVFAILVWRRLGELHRAVTSPAAAPSASLPGQIRARRD